MIKRMLRAVLLLIDMLLILPVLAAEFVLMVFHRIGAAQMLMQLDCGAKFKVCWGMLCLPFGSRIHDDGFESWNAIQRTRKSGHRTTCNTTIMHNSKKTYPYLTDGKGAGSFS